MLHLLLVIYNTMSPVQKTEAKYKWTIVHGVFKRCTRCNQSKTDTFYIRSLFFGTKVTTESLCDPCYNGQNPTSKITP